MHETYFDQGFRVIAIADESAEEVRALMTAKGGKYWIGIDPEQGSMQRYAGPGSLGIPQHYFVGIDGTVIGMHTPTPSQIEEELKKIFDPALGRELHEDLATATSAYERGAIGAAWVAASKVRESTTEAPAADAAFLVEKIETYATRSRDAVERSLAAKRLPEAMGELLLIEARFAGMECVAWAKEQIATLLKEDEIHAQRFAWDKLRKALAKEMKGMPNKGARRSVVTTYKQLIKAHPLDAAAEIAKARIEFIGEE